MWRLWAGGLAGWRLLLRCGALGIKVNIHCRLCTLEADQRTVTVYERRSFAAEVGGEHRATEYGMRIAYDYMSSVYLVRGERDAVAA